MNTFRTCLLTGVALLSTVSLASAAPFTLTTVLTGDARPGTPDDLEVLVTIAGDTTSQVTYWTVDLAMGTTHPGARLDEFGFNLEGATSEYTFGDFNLLVDGVEIDTAASYTPVTGTLNGSGGTTFLLTLDDPSGNRYDATNTASLTFTVTKTSLWSLYDFLGAPVSCSNNTLLGCNQLAAHLQGLTGGEGGVAGGDYPPAAVPEPTTLVLAGTGLLTMFLRRSRKSRQTHSETK